MLCAPLLLALWGVISVSMLAVGGPNYALFPTRRVGWRGWRQWAPLPIPSWGAAPAETAPTPLVLPVPRLAPPDSCITFRFFTHPRTASFSGSKANYIGQVLK